MASTAGYTAAQDELGGVLRGVRGRWRLRVALRGTAIVAAAGLLALFAATVGMEWFRFTAEAITAFRLATYVVIAGLVAWFLARPLARRVSDERMALYLEEHEPALDAAVTTAVEYDGLAASAGSRGSPDRATPTASQLESTSEGSLQFPDTLDDRRSPLVQRLVESAVHRVRDTGTASSIERPSVSRDAAILGGVALIGALVFAFGPDYIRHGARLLFAPWRSAEAATIYAIAVTPGNTTLARGGDQRIAAQLSGFQSEEVILAVQRGDTAWERIPMALGADSGQYQARLFDLDEHTRYYVEASGVRSPVFTLAVADLPAVQRLDLEYRFPAYTGLAPQTVEDGGDIAALRGTVVRLRVIPTMPVRAGRVVIEGRDTVALVADSAGALTGAITVEQPGFYKIELQGATGPMVSASLDYTIDVLEDGAPTVSIRKPGRDMKVTALEEVFAEVVAEDDYGVGRLELIYAVNGGARRTVTLRGAGSKPLEEVSAGHTFFLEEFGLQPGDLVSYFARATDADRVRGPKTATTDIYFLEVRPFGQEYRQAEQGGGGMQGGGEAPNALSQRQREIIAATFNAVRDRAITSAREHRENLATITLSQGRLRQQVEQLAERMATRGITGDSVFAAIAAEMPKAAAEMRAVEDLLAQRKPDESLPPEQRALQHLLRAEAAFRERQVSSGDQGGGGGGGATAEDLADLFELETDKLRNQYETVERGERQQADQEVDETLERLRKLAARQQQENERARRMAEQLQSRAGGGGRGGGSGAGGDSQRQLAQEAEQLARQLERLARERQSRELSESARRLREAANEMRRSASAGERGSAQGSSALDRIEDARRLLERNQSSRLDRDARDAQRRAEELAAQQREVAEDVGRLGEAGADRDAQTRRLMERKAAMADDVADLE
ncbi:MAG: hypothetical protein M3373_08555, partial [Gemmatimonadota bacterium]|nr:hypothetical protein [Gemmatimonadota bacterium]